MKRIIFLSVLVLLVTGGLLFAQSSTSSGGRGGAKTFDLTITSNVGSAQVFINGAAQNNKGMPFTASGLAGGSYNVVVKAPGYQDGSASVNLTANQTVTINLNSMTAALTVTSNVGNAQVFLNNTPQNNKGMPFTATLNRGTYSITLKAPGYYDGSATVNLTANQTVTVNLNPMMATLTVTSNVGNAMVYLNNAPQNNKGMPFSATLSLGSYNITLKAPGYFDGSTSVNLSSNQSVTINLQPMTATIIPMKPHPDFKVFVDGREITSPVTVDPGSHTVRYSIGALLVEQTFTFEAGKAYRFEPVLSMKFTN